MTRLRSLGVAMLVLVGIGIALGAVRMFSTTDDSPPVGGAHDGLAGQKATVFRQEIAWERSQADGIHHLFVHFVPTEGTWRPGETLTFQIRLKQPCDSWRISGGFDELTETIRGSKTNTTEINVSTRSSPKPGADVVIDVQAGVPPEIDQVAMSPREQGSSAGQ